MDPDEEAQETKQQTEDEEEEKLNDKRLKEFWMPDKYCKVCYGCEESFTMFRRRHHCRLCGQVFCNNCSNNFIEGSVLNMTGSIRVCRPCYDQSMDKTEKELTKSTKRAKSEKNSPPAVELPRALPVASNKAPAKGMSLPTEVVSKEQTKSLQSLQNRASTHLYGIIERLVNSSEITSNHDEWKQSIFNLVREVVSSVDPDVKAGDSIDIRPYVKVKVIPGGMMSECIYIDGVVFRKNVAHKKMLMGGSKINPRILLLASGIEFQRTDMKLSSMDTLIEQEDKFMEILVQKLMALKPG
ncbi:hypothetical protein EON65_02420 [archaeon]|nr:MAG: hypothetical protein EON65_02420 [archaeon]